MLSKQQFYKHKLLCKKATGTHMIALRALHVRTNVMTKRLHTPIVSRN